MQTSQPGSLSFTHEKTEAQSKQGGTAFAPKACKQKILQLRPSSLMADLMTDSDRISHPLEQENGSWQSNITLHLQLVWKRTFCPGSLLWFLPTVTLRSHKQPLLRLWVMQPFQINPQIESWWSPVPAGGATSRLTHYGVQKPHAKGWGAREHVGVSTALPLSGQVKRVRTSPFAYMSFRLNNTIYTACPHPTPASGRVKCRGRRNGGSEPSSPVHIVWGWLMQGTQQENPLSSLGDQVLNVFLLENLHLWLWVNLGTLKKYAKQCTVPQIK